MKNKAVDLTKGAILPTILQFAWPILISNIFQQLYNTADTMIVGRYLGEESLAAVGATAAIFELIVGFAIGVSNGIGIVIARQYGAKETEQVKRSVAATGLICLVLSSAIMLLGGLGLKPLLGLLGTPAAIAEQSYSYIFLILMGIGVTFAYNLGAGLLRAIGNSLTALYILVFAAFLNIVLDFYFITQLGLGVRSAGLATIISQGLAAVLCLIYIVKKVPILVPRKEHVVWDKGLYRELLSQGLAMGFMFTIVSIGSVTLQTAINSFGVLIIGAQTTARRLLALSLMPMTAIAASMTTFISQNVGAKQVTRIVRGLKVSAILVSVWGILAMAMLYLWAPFFIQLVSGSTELELLTNATLYLKIATPFYPILGCLFIFRNALQGLGNKVMPMVSSVIELFGKVGFVLFVIPKLGYLGVMICEPLIWVAMTIQLTLSLRREPLIQEGLAGLAKTLQTV